MGKEENRGPKGALDWLKNRFDEWGFDPRVVDYIKDWGKIREIPNGFALELIVDKKQRVSVSLSSCDSTREARLNLFGAGPVAKSILLGPEVLISEIQKVGVGDLQGLDAIGFLGKNGVLILSKEGQFSVRTLSGDSEHPFVKEQELIRTFIRALGAG